MSSDDGFPRLAGLRWKELHIAHCKSRHEDIDCIVLGFEDRQEFGSRHFFTRVIRLIASLFQMQPEAQSQP